MKSMSGNNIRSFQTEPSIKSQKDARNRQLAQLSKEDIHIDIEKPKKPIKLRDLFKSKREKVKSSADRKKNLLLEKFAIAPSPSRDYHGIHVYYDSIIWMRWRVSHTTSPFPQQMTIDVWQFAKDCTLQSEISYIFGVSVVAFILDLVNNTWKLESLPPGILQKISTNLSMKDVMNLGLTCKRLLLETSKDEYWELYCRKTLKLSPTDVNKAKIVGWKRLYFQKTSLSKRNYSSTDCLKSPTSKTTKKSTKLSPLKLTKSAITITQTANPKNILKSVQVQKLQAASGTKSMIELKSNKSELKTFQNRNKFKKEEKNETCTNRSRFTISKSINSTKTTD